jgi:transcriptional regulator with XRE-family HTH domain
MLSQIERGGANPTLAVAHRIAVALGMSLSDLVDTQSPVRPIQVIRGDDTEHLFRDDENCRIRTLSPLDLEKDIEFYELLLKPGKALVSSAHFEGTREFLTLVKGQVTINSGDDRQELSPGDSAHYAADLPDSIENQGRGAATAFLVVTYASGGRRS